MSIEVFNESGRGVSEESLIDVARYALGRMDVHPAAELSIHLVDEPTIEDLHIRWLDLPGPTDVMSFPMDELVPGGRPDAAEPGPAILGDIVICPEFAKRQAKEARRSYDHELAMLTIHGVLHLLGYDHAEPDEEKEMFGLQNSLLEDFYAERHRIAQAQRQSDRDTKLLTNIGFSDVAPVDAGPEATGPTQPPSEDE